MTDAENVDKKGRKRSKKRLRPFAFPTLQLRPRTENQPVEPIPTEPTADENIMENDVEVGAVPTIFLKNTSNPVLSTRNKIEVSFSARLLCGGIGASGG